MQITNNDRIKSVSPLSVAARPMVSLLPGAADDIGPDQAEAKRGILAPIGERGERGGRREGRSGKERRT